MYDDALMYGTGVVFYRQRSYTICFLLMMNDMTQRKKKESSQGPINACEHITIGLCTSYPSVVVWNKSFQHATVI